MSVGTNVRRQRDRTKMTQSVLADLVGVSQSTIHNWESEFSGPNGEEIEKLADAFEIPVSDLFEHSVLLKVIQKNKDNSHSNNQHIHPVPQSVVYEELISAQKELIQMQKDRIRFLELENERLRNV